MEPRVDPVPPISPPLTTLPGVFADEADLVEEKAHISTRLFAKFIDGLVAAIAFWVFATLLSSAFLGGLVAAAYVLAADGLDFGSIAFRSVGKHVTNLDVRHLDGEPLNLEDSARRNWMFALGFLVIPGLSGLFSLASMGLIAYEVYRMATSDEGHRWGDEIAGTQVIRI